MSNTFDPVWETSIYGQGNHLNRYPFDCIVSFIYRNYPRSKPRKDIRILEVGCGAGNNLWFAAREGFSVAGIDASPSAIGYAEQRFSEEGLIGDFRVGDFTDLPFEDNCFDLAIDRCALTCCGLSAAQAAVSEVQRTLMPGGLFFFNSYQERHSSCATGRLGADGVTLDIRGGGLVGVGQICFYSRAQVELLFAEGWCIRSLQALEIVEEKALPCDVHAEWRGTMEKY